MKRQTSLTGHIVQFCRFLRTKEYVVSVKEEQEVLLCLEDINWEQPTNLKQLLKAILCKNYREYKGFDELYAQYWGELKKAVDSKVKQSQDQEYSTNKPQQPSLQTIKQWLHGNKEIEDEAALARADDTEVDNSAKLPSLGEAQIREWHDVVSIISKYMANRPSRRFQSTHKVGPLHFRDTLSANLKFGGELMTLKFKRKKVRKTKIILLCDVSKSMDLYNQFIIQMMYSLQNSRLSLHTFVFSTTLTEITKKLSGSDLGKVLDTIGSHIKGWSGGTNMGASFEEFVKVYGSKHLGRRTFIFIVSDGWDGGDVELLAKSMKKLKEKSNQLLWVNPLAKSVDFVPEVLGMKAAIPYVDYLIPALDATGLKKYLSRSLK